MNLKENSLIYFLYNPKYEIILIKIINIYSKLNFLYNSDLYSLNKMTKMIFNLYLHKNHLCLCLYS